MLLQETDKIQQKIYDALRHRHLQNAFSLMQLLIQELQEWSARTMLDELETSYRYMIQYMLDGIKDPERQHVYNHLLTESYLLADTIDELRRLKSSSTLYYTRKRELQKSGLHLPEIFSNLDNSINILSLSELIPDSEDCTSHRREAEKAATRFFNYVWTNYPADAKDYATLREALSPHHLPDALAALIVSALTLNIIQHFDDEKMCILIDAYCNHNSDEVQIRALCGILIALLRYHSRLPLYEKLQARITLLFDDNRVTTDMRNIIFQFIRSRDTEKISRKMTEEILPKMMKISPSLYKKIKEDDAMIDIESLEQNPEWQEILEQSGIADNIKELNDLQMEGADVLMSTFAHLKGFDFFQSLSNWFMPFTTTHTAVTQTLGNEEWSKQFARLLQSSGFMCNSDKYSFCLSLSQVPESQRRLMAQQFDSQQAHLHEEARAELHRQSRERENISNRYIQDLYRFLKLHPQRNEFVDFFTTPIDKILQIDEFSTITQDIKLLKILGEYLFKNACYDDATYVFTMLSHNNFTDSELYQKIGYCHQSKGDYETALEFYLKADLIKPDHVWTLRRIATCYRNMKKTETAIQYFMRVDNLTPDNPAVNLNIGHCYLELKEYNNALKYYFKVDYLDSRSTKARRPIAWCSFLVGKVEQAWRYYEKILADTPTSSDYLNAGHVALSLGKMKDAIGLYRQSIVADNNNIENFTRSFDQDRNDLINAGIAPDDLPIIYDQVLYNLQQQV